MGFIDFVNNFFGSLRDFTTSSTDFKCSQCIKCRQCVKTLSTGEQIRLFTCPAVDDSLCDDAYIDSLLPSMENGLTTEYLEAYNNNREAIYNYLYSSPITYDNAVKPLLFDSCIPVTEYSQLLNFYKATSCPKFKPFIDSSNIVGYSDKLHAAPAQDLLSFENLSPEDKQMVTQITGW